MIAGWSHLGGRKGLVSGIILGGYGVGGSLYGLYYHSNIVYLNEEPVEDKRDRNLYFNKEVGARYPQVHKQAMITIFFVSLIAIAMVSNYKPPTLPIRGLERKSSLRDMTPAKRERLAVLGRSYTVRSTVRKIVSDNHIENSRGDINPVSPVSDDSHSDQDLQNFERQIENDLDDELEAEQKATTWSLIKSDKFILIYAMSVTQFMYPLYFDAIFKEIG